MEFFSRFAWAVPIAYADALSRCRFEEGDVLYKSQAAYVGNWPTEKLSFGHSLQLRFPERVSRGALENGDRVFYANWDSEARVDIYENAGLVAEEQVTTHGRVFTVLWTGDITVLDTQQPNPDAPLLVTQATKQLPSISTRAEEIAAGHPTFVLPRDLSNPVSRDKFTRVYNSLKAHLIDEPLLDSPERLGLLHWEIMSPTIEIAFFRVKDMQSDELFERVKKTVYRPSPKSQTDNFSMNKHGMIV